MCFDPQLLYSYILLQCICAGHLHCYTERKVNAAVICFPLLLCLSVFLFHRSPLLLCLCRPQALFHITIYISHRSVA